jgi:hypothetical protein
MFKNNISFPSVFYAPIWAYGGDLTFSRNFLSNALPRGWISESNICTRCAKLMSNVLVPGSRRSNQPYLGNKKIVKSPGCGTTCAVKLQPPYANTPWLPYANTPRPPYANTPHPSPHQLNIDRCIKI